MDATAETGARDARPGRSTGGVVLGSILLVLGVLLSLIGSAVLAAGVLAASANQLRDADGYFTAPTERFTTDSYALTSGAIGELTTGRGVQRLPFDLATIRLRATSVDSDVFIGIAPRADVDRYLDGAEHTEIRSIRYFPFEVEYRDVPGRETPAAPTEQDFWEASAAGPGTQELKWSIAPGEWRIVVMNADATPGVATELQAAVRSDLIAPAATALIVTGALMLVIGIPLLVIGATVLGRSVARAHPPAVGSVTPAAPVGALQMPARTSGPYPAHLLGVRDEHLSRGLWLVKWLLAIPHYVILVFLWFALAITTVIAGFAILFTGRYPHGLFVFNVGVLRWSWRVGFYAYSALGTDRYPPFTLARTDYPADFDVEYPERLSRGLVLVKWWLLAIPHYLILGAISGPVMWSQWGWERGDRDWGWGGDAARTGLSLLAVLVIIAGVALLFSARYPRGLFDLIVGINRWMFRVVTYAALLRDEYPPFRLDQGTHEPSASAIASRADQPEGTRIPGDVLDT